MLKFAAFLLGSAAFAAEADPVLDALDAEIARTVEAYAEQEDAPYYLSYRVLDTTRFSVSARYGALADSTERRSRSLGVTARVGDRQVDNTHPIRGVFWDFDRTRYSWAALPVDADVPALRSVVWRYTNRAIREAQKRILEVRANRAVKVEETDPSPDFSEEEPSEYLGPMASVSVDRAAWGPVLVELSSRLDANPVVNEASVDLDAVASTQHIVTSEGTRVREGRVWIRLSMWVSTVADDGMDLRLYRWKDVHHPERIPSADVLQGWADAIARDLEDLRSSAPGEPYSGPLLLRGRAAGVFVHEVIGHRAEGHRQKDEDEGQTFKDYVGKRVTLRSISIYDDPSLATYAGHDLNGHYRFDEEGQPGRRAVLVDHGVFKGFLMSRSPVEGFEHSNGHGRAASFARPVARMANTIVSTTDPRSYASLRRMLIAELRRQNRPYGIVVDEIGGGFTLTGRFFPNAFNVRAGTAWKVFADGRPDELVRGIDLVGTPLVALESIIAAGDDPDVFNGFCGAESGSVPNSAVSPSLLLRQLEVQRKEKGQDRPPLLPRPDAPPSGDT